MTLLGPSIKRLEACKGGQYFGSKTVIIEHHLITTEDSTVNHHPVSMNIYPIASTVQYFSLFDRRTEKGFL